MIDPSVTLTPAINWYFMIVSCLVLTVVGVFVNDRIIVPRLGEYKGSEKADERTATDLEKKGLRNAGIFTLIYAILLLICLVPQNGLLRGENGSILESPFITGLVPILIVYFVLAGVVYGKTVGTIKDSGDIPKMMANSLQSLTGYIVLVFVIAQFINMFSYTNLGTIIAVNASDALQKVGFTGIPLVIGVILLTIVVNFFMTSGTAKWYILRRFSCRCSCCSATRPNLHRSSTVSVTRLQTRSRRSIPICPSSSVWRRSTKKIPVSAPSFP